MKYQKVHQNTAAEIKVLFHIHNIRGQIFVDKFLDIRKANVYKHARKPLGTIYVDRRKENKGRPVKVNQLFERRIIRKVKVLTDAGNGFTSKDQTSLVLSVLCRVCATEQSAAGCLINRG